MLAMVNFKIITCFFIIVRLKLSFYSILKTLRLSIVLLKGVTLDKYIILYFNLFFIQ